MTKKKQSDRQTYRESSRGDRMRHTQTEINRERERDKIEADGQTEAQRKQTDKERHSEIR